MLGDGHLSQSQTTATRNAENTRAPTGSNAAQSTAPIAIVRATGTRVGRHSCKCANTRQISDGGPEASDPSDEVGELHGTIQNVIGAPVRVHDMTGDDLGIAHVPTPVYNG